MRQSHEIILRGGKIGVFSGSFERLLEDCQSLRPSAFSSTPAFYNSLMSTFENEVQRKVIENNNEDAESIKGMTMMEWKLKYLLGNRIKALISTGYCDNVI